MWVTLHDRAVHESSGVALIGITNHILVLSLIATRKSPLHASRETCTTTTTQSRLLDDVNYILGSLVLKCIRECHVAVASDVLSNVLWIDKTAITQSHTLLLAIEIHVFRVTNMLRGLRVDIEQTLYTMPANHMLLNDFFGIFGFNLCVKSVVGDNLNNRAFLTEAKASGHDYFYLICNAISFNSSLKVVDNFCAVRSFTACTPTAKQLNVFSTHCQSTSFFTHSVIAQLTNVQVRLSFFPELNQVFKVQGFHGVKMLF